MKGILICKSTGGSSTNENAWVVGIDKKPILFSCEEEARDYLKEYISTEKGIQDFGITFKEYDFPLSIGQAVSQLEDLIRDANTHRDENGELDDVFQRDVDALRLGCEALEKQMPKAPIGDLNAVPHYRCPNPACGASVKKYVDSPECRFCSYCGQALDWDKAK